MSALCSEILTTPSFLTGSTYQWDIMVRQLALYKSTCPAHYWFYHMIDTVCFALNEVTYRPYYASSM